MLKNFCRSFKQALYTMPNHAKLIIWLSQISAVQFNVCTVVLLVRLQLRFCMYYTLARTTYYFALKPREIRECEKTFLVHGCYTRWPTVLPHNFCIYKKYDSFQPLQLVRKKTSFLWAIWSPGIDEFRSSKEPKRTKSWLSALIPLQDCSILDGCNVWNVSEMEVRFNDDVR